MIGYTRCRAFTLIELSIVLVIIGLIVGGVLVGRDLITAANIRAQIKQITDIETQMQTFRTKFNCLPGDCRNAVTLLGAYGVGGATIYNGDGDFIIRSLSAWSGNYAAPECLEGTPNNNETGQVFTQLNTTGIGNYPLPGGAHAPETALAPGTTILVTCLTSVVQSGVVPVHMGAGNVMVLGNQAASSNVRMGYVNGLYGWYSTASGVMGIPQKYAFAIDSKLDDGRPESGTFGVISRLTSNPSGCNPGSNAYPAGDTLVCGVTAGKIIKSF